MDTSQLGMEDMFIWRLIPLIAMAFYLILVIVNLDNKEKRWVLPTHLMAFIGLLVMMYGFGIKVFTNPHATDLQYFAVTIAYTTTWFVAAFVAAGNAIFMPPITAIWGITFFLSLYNLDGITNNESFLVSIYIVAIMSNVLIWQKNKVDFEKFQINEKLKKKELELLQKNKEITKQSDAIQQQNQSISKQNKILEKMNQQLVTSNKLLENFPQIISHDLREPLRMINSYGVLLKNYKKKGLDQEGTEYLEVIVAASVRMERLLTDLFRFSQLTTKPIKVSTVDLNYVIQAVQHNLALKIEECDAKIQIEQLPTLSGNTSLLVQVFQNLIANAIKFQPNGQKPEINITYQELEEMYQITVQDNGIGIAPKDQDAVFNLFKRLHTIQEYQGSGIGLATCQQIIERFGGRINIQSELGNGSCFIIQWPKELI